MIFLIRFLRFKKWGQVDDIHAKKMENEMLENLTCTRQNSGQNKCSIFSDLHGVSNLQVALYLVTNEQGTVN